MDKITELERLAQLKEKWILTGEEFRSEKKKILEVVHEQAILEENIGSHVEVLPTNAHVAVSSGSWLENSSKKNRELLAMYFDHKWRINRLQLIVHHFLICLYFFLSVFFVVAILDTLGLDKATETKLSSSFILLAFIPLIYSSIMLFIKRFHDINQCGWFLLIPVYDFIAPAFFPWDVWDNRFGPSPR